MKWLLTLLVSLSLFSAGAQEIKKFNSEELHRYIQSSSKPVVVNFWATWCAPCVQEIPYFIQQVKEQGDSVRLLLVSLDVKTAYPGGIRDFAKSRNFDAEIVWLSESNADVFCPKFDSSWSGAIPASLMFNPVTGYRRFYEQALTERGFGVALRGLLRN